MQMQINADIRFVECVFTELIADARECVRDLLSQLLTGGATCAMRHDGTQQAVL